MNISNDTLGIFTRVVLLTCNATTKLFKHDRLEAFNLSVTVGISSPTTWDVLYDDGSAKRKDNVYTIKVYFMQFRRHHNIYKKYTILYYTLMIVRPLTLNHYNRVHTLSRPKRDGVCAVFFGLFFSRLFFSPLTIDSMCIITYL